MYCPGMGAYRTCSPVGCVPAVAPWVTARPPVWSNPQPGHVSRPATGSLPAAPPSSLAAALSGGLLPCLERLVRRAGAAAAAAAPPGCSPALFPHLDPSATEQLLLQFLLTKYDRQPYLVWLLAYGEPSEAAALVTSVGKLLRGVAAAAGMLSRAAGSDRDRLHARTAEFVVQAACRALLDMHALTVASARHGDGTMGIAVGAGAPEEGHEGSAKQLRRMAVLAACEWLPALFGMVMEAARQVVAVRPVQSQTPALQTGSLLLHTTRASLTVCVMWLPVAAMPSTAAASPVQSATTTAHEAAAAARGELGRWRLRRLAQDVPPVELVGAGMALMAHVMSGGELDGTDEELLALHGRMCQQLLSAGYMLAATSPDAVRRAVACGGEAAASGGGAPAHCTWRSSTVRQLLERLPRGFTQGACLAGVLQAWERGAEVVFGADGEFSTLVARLSIGSGRLEALGAELEQPSPLRRCSWWHCANLAGDSEAGLPLQACARCGGAWYCGRACQVAHWRAGHKAECGGGVGGGEGSTERV